MFIIFKGELYDKKTHYTCCYIGCINSGARCAQQLFAFIKQRVRSSINCYFNNEGCCKLIFLKNIFFSAVIFISLSSHALTSATSTKLNVYGIWLSTNADCSSPVEVLNSVTSTEYDMFTNPTFGSKAIASGTYKCLILKISDTVKFTPSTTTGSCTMGLEATIDICKASNTVNTSKDVLTGATINCLDTLGDIVYVYISSNSACADSISAGCNGTPTYPNSFLPPTQAADTLRGVKLTSDMVLTANATGTFVFNTDNKVDGSGGSCNLEPPVMSIR